MRSLGNVNLATAYSLLLFGVFEGGLPAPLSARQNSNPISTENSAVKSVTAMDQGQSEQDVEITRKLRREIIGHESMSVYADNVKVITKDGLVTLKGPVGSQTEKSLLMAMAKRIAGQDKVIDIMEVEPVK